MGSERNLMAGARVVKTRSDVDDETHLPAHGEYPPDQAVAVHRLPGTPNRHEVLNFRDSV